MINLIKTIELLFSEKEKVFILNKIMEKIDIYIFMNIILTDAIICNNELIKIAKIYMKLATDYTSEALITNRMEIFYQHQLYLLEKARDNFSICYAIIKIIQFINIDKMMSNSQASEKIHNKFWIVYNNYNTIKNYVLKYNTEYVIPQFKEEVELDDLLSLAV